MHRKNGFSLIELVMVIVILGILAVVAIPHRIDLKKEVQREAKEMEAIIYISYLHDALAGHVAEHYIRGTEWVRTGEDMIVLLNEGTEMPEGMQYKNNTWSAPDVGIEWEFVPATKTSAPRLVRKQ